MQSIGKKLGRSLFAFAYVVFFSVLCHATGSVTITPLQVNFGSETVGLTSSLHTLTLTNGTDSAVTVTSYSLSSPVFQLCQGLAPSSVPANGKAYFTLEFVPNAAGSFNGTFTVNLQGLSPLTVSLSGTGTTTGAIASVTPTTIDFGNVLEGTTSRNQTVKITNSGTTTMTVTTVTADRPFATNAITPKTLTAGQSYSFAVHIVPTGVSTFRTTLTIGYDVLPASGVNLTGAGTAVTALGVTTFPTLPTATQSAAYMTTLVAAGGTPPYTWSLKSGSTLPSGLSLSSTGVISGTLAASVGVGTYTFSGQAKDSASPPATKAVQFSLTVSAPTGAACNNISWNVAGGNTPILPLDVLGTGTYLGSEGGLYPDGSNIRPPDHDSYGVGLAQEIQPLDANGNPDPNGKYVLLGIGESDTRFIFEQFVADANADPTKNPSLAVVDGSQGSGTADSFKSTTSPYWNTIINYDLPNHGVTSKQVVAVWLQTITENPTGKFPSDMTKLQTDLELIAQNLLVEFPNIKLLYLSSRIYAGYSNGISIFNPEPYAFESGFANKWAIQDQLNGNANLNFNPALGPVLAPWMSWGAYYWANGMIPGSDGLFWTCQDLQNDGVHPSVTLGTEKAANELLNFFKTDDTTTPWFVSQ